MSAAAAVEKTDAVEGGEFKQWAEENFPGCSTVVSSVRVLVLDPRYYVQ